MVGWHHRLNGREFEQAPGVGDGQGGLVCCDSWNSPGQNTGVGYHFLLQCMKVKSESDSSVKTEAALWNKSYIPQLGLVGVGSQLQLAISSQPRD